MNKHTALLHLCLGMIALASCTGKLTSLVPDTPSKAPDYFCRVGLMAASPGDLSAPGLLIKIK